MRIMETKVYKFEELSEEVKDKVIEKLGDINTNYEWHEYCIENWVEKLNRIGFEVETKDIQYSGFWSQGDGACFTGKVSSQLINRIISVIPKFSLLKDLQFQGKIDITGHINNISNHYSHESTKRLELNLDKYGENQLDDILLSKAENIVFDELQEYLEDLRRNLCHKIYKNLEEEYEFLSSKEQIVETILSNDYEFNEKGEIV